MTQTLLNYPSDTNRHAFQAAPAGQLNASQAALNAAIKNLTDAITAAQATLATLNSAATDPNISSDGSGHLVTKALTVAINFPTTFSHCFLFDGSTYATASNAALNGWTAQTIAFWMWAEPGVNGANPRLVEKGENDEWTIILNNLGGSDQNTVTLQQIGTASGGITSTKIVCDGKWHLVVVTIDAATGNQELFVDNISQGTLSSGPYSGSTSGDLNISQYGGGGYNFVGALNEITIWGRVLSGSELNALWNGGAGVIGDTSTGPWNSGLELMYHLDQSTGTTFTDSGPNSITSSTISGTIDWETPGALAFGVLTTIVFTNLPSSDPANAGQVYSDGVPSPGNPMQLMVSGG